ncbi:MAG: hypothetical protein FWG10_14530 [Eubacteriaceae bacterium]|nr:hypothetical protein [Eubacteriaceae bacterium]
MDRYTDGSRIAGNEKESAHAKRRCAAAAKRKAAVGMGALVDAPAMQALVTKKELQFALSTFANPHAYIVNAGNAGGWASTPRSPTRTAYPRS